jgi:EmrB/QacA subfamily drug resistance transporter
MNFFRTPCEHVAISSTSITLLAVPKEYEKWVLTATILGSSMAFIDGTVVNVALPALQDALHASVSQIQWVIEAYSLALAALLLAGGALGDLYGRRFIFLVGVVVFTASSVWCGLAASISQIIMARTIQGVGAAFLVPGSLALITASFSKERRGQAIGTWAGFTAITTAAGPVLGGWLVQHASWRWIFFLNVPLAAIVFIITLLYVFESRNEQQCRGLDIIGILLATVGLGAIVFGLIEWEYGSTVTIMAEVVGVCALLGFFFVEAQVASPMVPLEMFRSYNFSGANLITFFLYFALYGVLFFFPLDLIQVQGYTATQAGAALLPFILLMFLLSRWAGGLVKQFGSRLPLVVGPAIAAIGFALFIRSGIGNSYWTSFFPAVMVLGLGMAVSVAPLTTVVMNSIAQEHVGAASGINNAISRIAGLLAIAIFGLVMTTIFNQNLIKNIKTDSIPIAIQQEIINQRSQFAGIKTTNEYAQRLIQESFIVGYKTILWIAVAMAFASSLSAVLLINGKVFGDDVSESNKT